MVELTEEQGNQIDSARKLIEAARVIFAELRDGFQDAIEDEDDEENADSLDDVVAMIDETAALLEDALGQSGLLIGEEPAR